MNKRSRNWQLVRLLFTFVFCSCHLHFFSLSLCITSFEVTVHTLRVSHTSYLFLKLMHYFMQEAASLQVSLSRPWLHHATWRLLDVPQDSSCGGRLTCASFFFFFFLFGNATSIRWAPSPASQPAIFFFLYISLVAPPRVLGWEFTSQCVCSHLYDRL